MVVNYGEDCHGLQKKKKKWAASKMHNARRCSSKTKLNVRFQSVLVFLF